MATLSREPVGDLGRLQSQHFMPGSLQLTIDGWRRPGFSVLFSRRNERGYPDHRSRNYPSEAEWQRAVDKEAQNDAVSKYQDPDSDRGSSRTSSNPSSPVRSFSASSATSIYSDAEDEAKRFQKPQRQHSEKFAEALFDDVHHVSLLDAGRNADEADLQSNTQLGLVSDNAEQSSGTDASLRSASSSIITTIDTLSCQITQRSNEDSKLEERFRALHVRTSSDRLQPIKDISWDSVVEEDVSSLCAAYNLASKKTADSSYVSSPVENGNAISNDLPVKSLHTQKHLIEPLAIPFTAQQPDQNRPDKKRFHVTPPEYVIDTSYLANSSARFWEQLSSKKLNKSETQCSKRERLEQQQQRQQQREQEEEEDRQRLIATMISRLEANEIRLDHAIRAIQKSDAIRASQKKEEDRFAEQSRIEQENRVKAIALKKQLEEEEALAAEARRAAELRARFKECNVCGDTKDKTSFHSTTPTSRCKHDSLVCKKCLDSWISSRLSDHGVDGIICPECPEKLAYEEVKAAASTKTFETYDQLTTRNALSALPEFAWCLSPGCKSGQLNIENSNFMHCKACGYKQCLKHQVEWHTGEDCKTYEYRTSGAKSREEEAKTLAMLDSMSKVCPGPGCGWRIQKIEGCDHVTCRKCKFEFCWQCLASHKEIKSVGNSAHKKDCKFHSDNLDLAWPFNRH